MTRMRVLIADDRIEVRSALRLLIEQTQPGWQVEEATRVSDITYLLQVHCPDILLLDWELPGLGGARAYDPYHPGKVIAQLRRQCPGMKILALGGTPEAKARAISAGADSFSSKTNPPELLLQALTELFRSAARPCHAG